MTAATTSLIPGLDEIVRNGDPKRCAEAARRISELFLADAANLRADHVDLFDGILIELVPHTELGSRADLAERLSLLANAPDDGSPSAVEVPLSLQYRTLSMRQVPLVRLPELDWPQP